MPEGQDPFGADRPADACARRPGPTSTVESGQAPACERTVLRRDDRTDPARRPVRRRRAAGMPARPVGLRRIVDTRFASPLGLHRAGRPAAMAAAAHQASSSPGRRASAITGVRRVGDPAAAGTEDAGRSAIAGRPVDQGRGRWRITAGSSWGGVLDDVTVSGLHVFGEFQRAACHAFAGRPLPGPFRPVAASVRLCGGRISARTDAGHPSPGTAGLPQAFDQAPLVRLFLGSARRHRQAFRGGDCWRALARERNRAASSMGEPLRLPVAGGQAGREKDRGLASPDRSIACKASHKGPATLRPGSRPPTALRSVGRRSARLLEGACARGRATLRQQLQQASDRPVDGSTVMELASAIAALPYRRGPGFGRAFGIRDGAIERKIDPSRCKARSRNCRRSPRHPPPTSLRSGAGDGFDCWRALAREPARPPFALRSRPPTGLRSGAGD